MKLNRDTVQKDTSLLEKINVCLKKYDEGRDFTVDYRITSSLKKILFILPVLEERTRIYQEYAELEHLINTLQIKSDSLKPDSDLKIATKIKEYELQLICLTDQLQRNQSSDLHRLLSNELDNIQTIEWYFSNVVRDEDDEDHLDIFSFGVNKIQQQ